ncbi:MAG: hypothetical protein AAB505_01645 [Patescibacteria group bacterium]
MSKSGTVPAVVKKPMTFGQTREICSALVHAMPITIDFDQAEKLVKEKREWQRRVGNFLIGATDDAVNIGNDLEWWEQYYLDQHQRRIDLNKLTVPTLPTGRFRQPTLLVVDPNLSLDQIYRVNEVAFPCFRYTKNLDQAVTINQPRPESVYALWTEGAVEPSEEYSNLSPDQLDQRGLIYSTIGERMLLEALHHQKIEGGHLDLINVTITSSRYSDGRAVGADWDGRQFKVGWWLRDGAHPDGRTREVVLNS